MAGLPLTVWWNGTDLSAHATVTRCVVTDRARGAADETEIEFDGASIWKKWQPAPGDRVRVDLDGYTTGEMELATVLPWGRRYRALATALPSGMRVRRFACYSGARLGDILSAMAGEGGLEWESWGVDGNIRYDFLMRSGMSAAGFLDWLGEREGFCLKRGKKLQVIGLDWAAALPPADRLWMEAEAENVQHTLRAAERVSRLTLKGADCEGAFTDPAAAGGHPEMIPEPVRDPATARRWARNLCLERNGAMEEVEIETAFNPAATALCRLDLQGDETVSGGWTVWQARHDLVNGRSALTLRRAR